MNNEISGKMTKIEEDKKEIQKQEQLRVENKMEHEKNVKNQEKIYKKTRIDLISKMKWLSEL